MELPLQRGSPTGASSWLAVPPLLLLRWVGMQKQHPPAPQRCALPPQGSEGCKGGQDTGRRDVGMARPGMAVTQRRELRPHTLQLSARSLWVPSTRSARRPHSQHPQAAGCCLVVPRVTCHHCGAQGCCQHSSLRMLCQHPRTSHMASPQGLVAGDPRDTTAGTQVPSPMWRQLCGRVCPAEPAPLSPQKAD